MKLIISLVAVAMAMFSSNGLLWGSKGITNKHILGKVFNGMTEPTDDVLDSKKWDGKKTAALDEYWSKFKILFSKDYSATADETSRRIQFEQRIRMIASHNKNYAKGKVNYRMGTNKFADQTIEEVKKTAMGNKGAKKSKQTEYSPLEIIRKNDKSYSLPKTVDWRTSGCTTPVKNQGSCGSCYAFSAVTNLETMYCLYDSGTAVMMSPQNVIDCSYYLGNEGCSGGYMRDVFVYVANNDGIDTEAAYPYVSGNDISNESCAYSKVSRAGTALGYYVVPSYNRESMKYHVAKAGTITVGIYAAVAPFIYYEEGVMDSSKCSSDVDDIDHGVVVEGYGKSSGLDYWLIRNRRKNCERIDGPVLAKNHLVILSWGSSWGDNGYIKVAMKNNLCGVLDEPSYPATPGLAKKAIEKLETIYTSLDY